MKLEGKVSGKDVISGTNENRYLLFGWFLISKKMEEKRKNNFHASRGCLQLKAILYWKKAAESRASLYDFPCFLSLEILKNFFLSPLSIAFSL